MIRGRIALWLMGSENLNALDQITGVVLGTRKSYEVKTDAKILDLLVSRWLKSEDVK